MGRPSSFTQETADSICEQLANGDSLRKICSIEGMPILRTVFRWLDDNESFRHNYARATDVRAEAFAHEIVEISDRDDIAPDDKRVRVDARKWVASRLLPKKYGDRLDTTISAPDGGPISLTVKFGREE